MHTTSSRLALFLSLVLTACSSDGGEAVCSGDVRLSYEVYYGTLEPSYVPLSPGQILAIGDFGYCSGTLIAPEWVLSAKHCSIAPGAAFCMGPQPSNADVCIFVAEVIPHPDASNDLALLRLGEDARTRVPEVEPIPIMTAVMGNEWIGRIAEGAGYGLTEEQTTGTRYFTAEPISSLDEGFLIVDGQGQHGLCNGDSGGPVMVLADDATVRVAGALYGGDASCVGKDSYTRTDRFAPWIESYTGPTSGNPADCGTFDAIGACYGTMAVWCGGAMLESQECAAGTTCGWDETQGGFRCIAGDDPCGGFDRRGGCDGAVASWCEGGVLRQRDCGSCNMACDAWAVAEGAYCREDPCMGLDFLGRCDGNVAEWCEGGVVQSLDCDMTGQTCGWIDDQTGYFCQ